MAVPQLRIVRLKMKYKKNTYFILWIEAIGFISIITLSWLDEMIGLPRLLFGAPPPVNWHEAVIETVIVLLAWLSVHTLTKRLLERLHYLEEFLRVCAWCRKIAHDDEWLPIEEYFSREFATKTSHGLCPDCAKKMAESINPEEA